MYYRCERKRIAISANISSVSVPSAEWRRRIIYARYMGGNTHSEYRCARSSAIVVIAPHVLFQYDTSTINTGYYTIWICNVHQYSLLTLRPDRTLWSGLSRWRTFRSSRAAGGRATFRQLASAPRRGTESATCTGTIKRTTMKALMAKSGCLAKFFFFIVDAIYRD